MTLSSVLAFGATSGVRKLDVKICGLSTPATIAAVLQRGASHAGFVHFAKSPRHLDGAAMAEPRARATPRQWPP
ncbi:hypothetical protein LCGC14_0296920 [marine sediment metagenome]|uniref:Phosphoribosylanthranilate isomerase n=1 Tax=marine sediment metagenome TaxID=412755 RepID=A0A0F9TRE4_9ZZZZ